MTRLEKILNNLPTDTIKEMEAADSSQLKAQVVASEQAITNTKQQLEDSPAYQQAKEDLKALTAGYRDLRKYQTAKIQYALILLEEKGE